MNRIGFVFREKGHEAWIGLEGAIINDQEFWFYEHGFFKSDYRNWASSQPEKGKFCSVYAEDSAAWKSADCKRPKTYICKRG